MLVNLCHLWLFVLKWYCIYEANSLTILITCSKFNCILWIITHASCVTNHLCLRFYFRMCMPIIDEPFVFKGGKNERNISCIFFTHFPWKAINYITKMKCFDLYPCILSAAGHATWRTCWRVSPCDDVRLPLLGLFCCLLPLQLERYWRQKQCNLG